MYLNDGDWVESCTALVEHQDGKLELVDWVARNKLSLLAQTAGKVSTPQASVMQAVAAEIAAAQRETEPACAVPAGV
jgi:thymidine phosphorylase